MKSVTADLNRRGPHGAVKVSLRRFSEFPSVGDRFVVNDGDDKFVGTVSAVDSQKRTVLMDMEWRDQLSVAGLYASFASGLRMSSPSPQFGYSNERRMPVDAIGESQDKFAAIS